MVKNTRAPSGQSGHGKKSRKTCIKNQKKRCALTSAVAALSKRRQPLVTIDAFEREAKRFGFDANHYLSQGYTVLKAPVLSRSEQHEALEAARRVHKGAHGGGNGEFVSLREGVCADKKKLFALLHKYNPLLRQLFNGIRLPWSDKSPYAHHNQIQLAIKRPGFKGYDELSKMKDSEVGHVDQTDGSKKLGRVFCNYTALFGIVLSGDTKNRDDAGNLWLAPRSSRQFANKFKQLGRVPTYKPDVKLARQCFGKKKMPAMQAVRAEPGQAILMQWQTIHGVGPNHSGTDRVHFISG